MTLTLQWAHLIQFLVDSLLNIWMMDQVKEGPHEAGRGGLHSGQEEINQAVEEGIVTLGMK